MARGAALVALAIGSCVAVAACGEDVAPQSGRPPTLGLAAAQRQCAGCHGATFAGTRVGGWAPNLTPDPETGLGGWSDDAVVQAVRGGVSADGRALCTTMPRFTPSELPDAELVAVVGYLRSIAPRVSPSLGSCDAGITDVSRP